MAITPEILLPLLAVVVLVSSGLMLVGGFYPGVRQSEEEDRTAGRCASEALTVAVLTGSAVTSAGCLLALPLAGVLWKPPWSLLVRPELAAAVAIAALVLFFHGHPRERMWHALGATIAGALPCFAQPLMMRFDVQAATATPTLAILAAVACALFLSTSRRARLIARVRDAAVDTAGDGLLTVDMRGRIIDANHAASEGLKLPPREAWKSKQPKLPSALQALIGASEASTGRLKSASGRFFEAWTTAIAPRGPLKTLRGILLRDVTTRHIGERKLHKLAHYDSLTGLANRRLFLETLTQQIESGRAENQQVALFYIDLDHFKSINDSLGHSAGDALLQVLADRFRGQLENEHLSEFGVTARDHLCHARLAGDEFAVIAPGVHDIAGVARRIVELIGRPMELAGRPIVPSGSVGVAVFPEDGEDVETLIRHADAALYVAKSRGRKRFARFEASFEAKADRARLVEEGLRTAIENDELAVYYQPKIELASGRAVGFEALLRWKSEALGDIGPAEFIPVAESHGLIGELGSWILDETCRQLREWQDAGFTNVPISVNVSSAQFADTDLQRVVSDALKNHRVDPELLELELTESLLLEEGNSTELTLRDLRAIGIRIALDDFGTGYSALTYLNRFNLDVLKIDRELLRNIDNDASAAGIASAVVSMAHSLGLTVVAEGIDVETQLPPLRRMKCDQIQGFLYSPGVAGSDAVSFLARVGEKPPIAKPGAGLPGNRPSTDESRETSLPSEDGLLDDIETIHPEEKHRMLLVDDGSGALGPLALRLGRLDVEIHYAAAPDEAFLFIAQEKEAIRLLLVSPDFDLSQAEGILSSCSRESGVRPPLVTVGEEPSEARRAEIREAGVSWVLWAPFDDSDLRYLVKSAMALPRDLSHRVEPRLPVDLVANIRLGDRREMAVISSLSSRGAFVEMSEPPPAGAQFQLEFEISGHRFRGFARVVHQEIEDEEKPDSVSGVSAVFFGIDNDTERMLLKAVKEREARFLP